MTTGVKPNPATVACPLSARHWPVLHRHPENWTLKISHNSNRQPRRRTGSTFQSSRSFPTKARLRRKSTKQLPSRMLTSGPAQQVRGDNRDLGKKESIKTFEGQNE